MHKLRVRKDGEFIKVTLSEYGELPLLIGIFTKREAKEYSEHLAGTIDQIKSYLNE